MTSVSNQYSNLTTVAAKPNTATTSSSNTTNSGQVSQAQFLKLMTAQMTHQDPSKPMQNGEFLTQMAQFGTVSGIQDLQKSFSDFSNSISSGQALQASSLVGHDVLAKGDKGALETGKSLNGQITLPGNTTNLQYEITNSKTGKLVNNINLGTQAKGTVPFQWDGTDNSNQLAEPGVYSIKATATIDGKNTQLNTLIQSQVESVSMASGVNGVTVNLAQVGSVNFNDVQQIL